jgi:hypothetical protein
MLLTVAFLCEDVEVRVTGPRAALEFKLRF